MKSLVTFNGQLGRRRRCTLGVEVRGRATRGADHVGGEGLKIVEQDGRLLIPIGVELNAASVA